MLTAAAEAASNYGPHAPLLLGVTALTSASAADLAETGVTRNIQEQVQALEYAGGGSRHRRAGGFGA